jgi:hypothetical protein
VCDRRLAELPGEEDLITVEDMVEVDDAEVEILEHATERAHLVELQLEVGDDAVELIPSFQDRSRQVARAGTLWIMPEAFELRRARDHVPAERDQLLKDQRQLWNQRVQVVDRHFRSTVYSRGSRVRKFVARWVLLWFVAATACSLDPPRKQTLVEGLPRTENVVELQGVAIDRFEQDHLSVRAELATAKVDREKGTITGETIAISVLDESGETTATILAPKGRAERGTAVLEGGVTLRDAEERVVRSETMIYDAAKDAIRAPNEVTIEGANFRARGASLIATRTDQLIEVSGPVSATVAPDKRSAPRKRP